LFFTFFDSRWEDLAGNKKTPFNPHKEFFGQGMVQIITPLVQDFPCTGLWQEPQPVLKQVQKRRSPDI